MPTKFFTTGRIRKADYNPASQQLDLHFDNGSILAYKQVPGEVWRRLCSAPNAPPIGKTASRRSIRRARR
jgi:hypothetical protein